MPILNNLFDPNGELEEDPLIEIVYPPRKVPARFERRAHRRIALDVPIVLQFDADASWVETDASLVDLSDAGMLVMCDRLPAPNQRVALALDHRILGACVAWGASARFTDRGFAVQFARTNIPMRQLVCSLSRPKVDSRHSVLSTASSLRIKVSPPPSTSGAPLNRACVGAAAHTSRSG